MEFQIIDSWTDIELQIIDKYFNSELQNNIKTKKSLKKEYLEINTRLKNNLYKNLNNQSCINTLHYIYHKIRSGIFVKIQNNQLVAFIPFANKEFRNNWKYNIKLYTENYNSRFSSLQNFIHTKKKYLKQYKNYIKDINKWWVNAYILNNEEFENVWGQHSLKEYYDIIINTLETNTINDCYFIINKRDHPILHQNLYEPYPNMYKNHNQKIENIYQSKSYIPILSPYTNQNYLDIPFIIPQDWQLATSENNYYNIEKQINWEDKIEIAFFRGSATGSMELKYNQRLQISQLDYIWRTSKPGLLDAGIVSWNSRDKIDSNFQINYIKPSIMMKQGIKLKNKIPMNEQIQYKYIINIDGHSSPNRTSYLLQSGSLMLMVESMYVMGNTCWFYNMLKPYIHYIPIKYDLSDLEEQIIWCKLHDKECKQITNNAFKFYQTYFNKKKILEHSAYILNQIANNFN